MVVIEGGALHAIDIKTNMIKAKSMAVEIHCSTSEDRKDEATESSLEMNASAPCVICVPGHGAWVKASS